VENEAIAQVTKTFVVQADELAKINEDAGEVLLLPKTLVKSIYLKIHLKYLLTDFLGGAKHKWAAKDVT
jgi:hypothetical protein